MDTIVAEGTLGYVTFDMKKRLLGCNVVAENYFPELKSARTDMPLDNHDGIKGKIAECIDYVEKNKKPISIIVPCQSKEIRIEVDEYLLRGRMKSYRIVMADDTDHQSLIKLLNNEKDAAKQETKHVTDTFHRYVDPSIADRILKEKQTSDGAEKNIAILFADIRGFTTYSESNAPRDVLGVLNVIIEMVTSCIMNNGGIVDKFIGDCVMAVWYEDSLDATYCACKAALDIQHAMNELGEKIEQEFGTKLHLGIGINYGPAIVGNVGTEKRSDYTAIGDTVNVASRLENMAPPDEILVTSMVAEKLNGKAEFTPYNRSVTLKGRSQGTAILKLEAIQ